MRAEFGFAGGDAAVLKCFLLWAALVGAISLEVFGQYGADTLTDPADVFDGQIRLVVAVADVELEHVLATGRRRRYPRSDA